MAKFNLCVSDDAIQDAITNLIEQKKKKERAGHTALNEINQLSLLGWLFEMTEDDMEYTSIDPWTHRQDICTGGKYECKMRKTSYKYKH